CYVCFFFSSRRRHTRFSRDWSSDVCSSDLGWEGVGLCSYLLIGFWFSEEANASAGKKAFITNRIGDFGLLIAMGLLAYYVGALRSEERRVGKEWRSRWAREQ